MEKLSLSNFVVITAHALVVWLLYGGLMFAGISLFSLGYALVIHAIGAPIIAGLVALITPDQPHRSPPRSELWLLMFCAVLPC